MEEAILLTVKKYLGGVAETDTVFDDVLIHLVNTALISAFQIGVGSKPFTIKTGQETWADFLEDVEEYEIIKTYICQSVKLRFDPPSSSYLQQAMVDDNRELAWRASVFHDEVADV